MSLFHAVVRIDHQSAQILQFDAEHVRQSKVKAHTHHTPQHGSGVRTQHEFYGDVCDALAGIAEVLVAGPRTGMADFEHYVKKHRADVGSRIVGWEAVDHPSDKQLIALARKTFLKLDQMAGTPMAR